MLQQHRRGVILAGICAVLLVAAAWVVVENSSSSPYRAGNKTEEVPANGKGARDDGPTEGPRSVGEMISKPTSTSATASEQEEAQRVEVPAVQAVVSCKDLQGEAKKMYDFVNRTLVEAGKPPILEDNVIAREELPGFVAAVKEMMDTTDKADNEWRDAANRYSRTKREEIAAAIREGRIPDAERLPPGAPLPKVTGATDLVTVYHPMGSRDSFVIHMPSQLFPVEISAYKNQKSAQLTFFDEAMRRLFSNPSGGVK